MNIDTLIEEQQWDRVRSHFLENPEEASKMVNPSLGWTKLHWLCSMGSTPSSLIDLVASLYPQAITMPDNRYGDTPLHLACRNAQVTIKKPIFLLNRLRDYQKEGTAETQNDDDNKKKEDKKPAHPPGQTEAMQGVLIRNRFGGTALHSACNHNAHLGVIQELVKVNPRLLSLTTFDGIPPLSALYTAYIQTIPGYMAVARRLKGEEVSESNHFERFWKKVVFLTTYEYALQQQSKDDATTDNNNEPPTRFVLHGLLRSSHLLVNFYKLALKHDPELAMVADQNGDLPLHLLIDRRPFRLKEREAIEATLLAGPKAASTRNGVGDFPLLAGIRNKIPWNNGLDLLTETAPPTAQLRDVQTNLLPFQLAASVGGKVALDTTFQLLTIQPDLLVVKTAPSPPTSPATKTRLLPALSDAPIEDPCSSK